MSKELAGDIERDAFVDGDTRRVVTKVVEPGEGGPVVEALVNALAEAIPAPAEQALLIVDDYHFVAASPDTTRAPTLDPRGAEEQKT